MTTGAIPSRFDETKAGVLDRIFPGRIDNNFRGHWFSLVLFGAYVFGKLGQGAKSIFDTYSDLTTADGIPLGSYDAAAVHTLSSMQELLGLNLLVLPALGLLALVRYRAMIPLMYFAMLLLYLGSRIVLYVHPILRVGGAQPRGFYVNMGLAAVLLVGFFLSLARERDVAEPGA